MLQNHQVFVELALIGHGADQVHSIGFEGTIDIMLRHGKAATIPRWPSKYTSLDFITVVDKTIQRRSITCYLPPNPLPSKLHKRGTFKYLESN